MIRGSKKLMTYIKKENKIVKSDYFELEGVTNPTDDDWIHVFLDRCKNNIDLFNTEYEKQKQWKILLSNYDYDILNFLKKCYMEFYPEDAKKEVEEEAKKAEQDKKDQEEFEKEWELKASPLRASPLRASPRRFEVSNDAPRRKASEPRKLVISKPEVLKQDKPKKVKKVSHWEIGYGKSPQLKEHIKKVYLSEKWEKNNTWCFTRQWYHNDYNTSILYTHGFFSAYNEIKYSINPYAYPDRYRYEVDPESLITLDEIEEKDTVFRFRSVYDLHLGQDVKKHVKNPICEVSKEPLEDDDNVLVKSALPPFLKQDDKGNQSFRLKRKVGSKGEQNYSRRRHKDCVIYKDGRFETGGMFDLKTCVIANNWEFQTFVKLKYITSRSRELLLQRSPPIGYTDTYGWTMIDYDYQGEMIYPKGMKITKTLGQKLRKLRERVKESKKKL
jgi:hypothetical protein